LRIADPRERIRDLRGHAVRLRSPYDGEILGLAVPALGSLAAEPLYLLVDTAIVGHLGRSQLAALGIAATVLGAVFAIFNFLQYGTTAQVARAVGAGADEAARRLGATAAWLSLAFGIAVAALVAGFAGPIVELMGGEGQTADYAVTYLRIASIGLPMALLALGGQGFLRGVADLRTPLVIVIAGNAVNVVVEVLFVYVFDWGIEGSAWGTVVAQLGMGAAFVVVIVRRLHAGDAAPRLALARRLLSLGKHIFFRTTALMSSFVLAGAVAARVGDPALGAHQVAFQLWIFLALVLDSIAIAGQIIVGRELGAARTDRAYDASVRMIVLSAALGGAFAVAMLALGGVLPDVFTGDALVLEQAALLWPLFALMQPLNGAVFALDGILIGAGDGPFLAASMALAFACCAAVLLAVLVAGWGIRGVWSALVVLILVRLAAMTARFRRRRWLVTGWAA
jgi:putative MATE family efflux protein